MLWQHYKKSQFIFIWNLQINQKWSTQNLIKDRTDLNFSFFQVLTYCNTWCLNLLRNIYNEKFTQTTISMPKAITEITPDEWTKDERKTQIPQRQ